ncbi:MAG: septum formation protein Maf [Ruminococcaceae bacterium]|nr:septum formation protein Maf [Oscillospiraceae bacterium]
MKLILASASPRRHEILSLAGLDHEIRPSDADESAIAYTPHQPEQYVIALAGCKADAVPAGENEIVLSADTIVYVPETDEILGKPKDRADAVRMLSLLSGSTHKVITGVCIADASGITDCFAVVSDVHFRTLSEAEIGEYIDRCRPFDKAGAYGIQEGACHFVDCITGDYYNIVGLPICAVYTRLRPLIFENNSL